jgi:hypothetical protein
MGRHGKLRMNRQDREAGSRYFQGSCYRIFIYVVVEAISYVLLSPTPLEPSWPEASTYNKSNRITKRTDLKGDFFN